MYIQRKNVPSDPKPFQCLQICTTNKLILEVCNKGQTCKNLNTYLHRTYILTNYKLTRYEFNIREKDKVKESEKSRKLIFVTIFFHVTYTTGLKQKKFEVKLR